MRGWIHEVPVTVAPKAWRPALICLIMSTQFLTGCASTRCAPGRSRVDCELQTRVQNGLTPAQCGESLIPADVDLDDGVTADEAVAVALWNNSAFNATLARLGMARGDLVQAGLLRNPSMQIFLPGGTKQLEWTLYLPIDVLLLRETRLDMSEREVCRVADELVQNGLDLVRDTRVAHTDLLFAVDRAALAGEAVELRQRIADLTQKQLEAGDISELEATTAHIDLLRARADAAGLNHAVAQADSRLRQLMGIGTWSQSLTPLADDRIILPHHQLDALVAEALASRPDVRAAALAVEAAKIRADISRWQWLRFDAVTDANSGGAGNSNIGPGFRFDIPIFDRNQGGIQTADWTVYQATQNYHAVRDQVVTDVQTAYAQSLQATDSLSILQSEVLSSLQEAVQLAGKAYADGGAPYFLVLQTTGQFLDSRTQELQLQADLRKAHANLERSVGRNLLHSAVIADATQAGTATDGKSDPDVDDTSNRQLADSDDDRDILIIAADGSSIFCGETDREHVGKTLRRIADRLDAAEHDSRFTTNVERDAFAETRGGFAATAPD